MKNLLAENLVTTAYNKQKKAKQKTRVCLIHALCIIERNVVKLESCIWCGFESEIINAPTHKYLESSAGCWSSYGEVLEREYSNVDYFVVHGLTVDAFALQHPGIENPQTISSVNVHLASLYSYFELGTPLDKLSLVRKLIVKHKESFIWLKPPKDLTSITTTNILTAKSAIEHQELVKIWARYVFEQWYKHHNVAAKLLCI